MSCGEQHYFVTFDGTVVGVGKCSRHYVSDDDSKRLAFRKLASDTIATCGSGLTHECFPVTWLLAIQPSAAQNLAV